MSTELLFVVDEHNQPVEPAPMSEVYDKKLHHRIVHICLVNERGEILMQQRSASRSFKPLAWMHAAGGHVQANELAADAATRELREEMGIATPLKEILNGVFEVGDMKKFFTVFVGTVPASQSIQLDPEEVADWKWVSLADLSVFIRENDYLEESRFVLQMVIERGLL